MNRKQKQSVILFIGSLVSSYLAFSYASGDFNPMHLSEGTRVGQLILIGAINGFGNMIIHLEM